MKSKERECKEYGGEILVPISIAIELYTTKHK